MSQNSNQRGKTVIVIVIIVFVLSGLAGTWYWVIYKPEQEAKEKARLEQLAREEAERKRKEIEAQNKVKYDELIENADAEFEQENWETAQTLYSEASSLFSDQQHPKNQLALIRTELDKIAARKAAGIVETVSSPTGRFYVIVSSSVDGDLAMDYASKLAKEGNNVKMIEPYAPNKLFHRVSIDDYETWEQAVTASSSFGTYGNEVWVLEH